MVLYNDGLFFIERFFSLTTVGKFLPFVDYVRSYVNLHLFGNYECFMCIKKYKPSHKARWCGWAVQI